MDASDKHIAAPIFVVGSPRSGTSILTWCLGQHPNILPTEESDWLGPFAVQVAAHHRRGSARGERSQLSALGIERTEFFQTLGNAVDAMIVGHRRTLEQLNRAVAERDPAQVCADFAVARGDAEPKARWVDGTPEYSLYLCGLHKLFPAAKFIHILREPDAVAASMLAFRHADGSPLVSSADEAYAYWERTTTACALAAQALGANVVFRLPHALLVAQPAAALHDVFEFLGEEFTGECVAPLAHRINSSFGADASSVAREQAHAAADVVERARQLHARISAEPVPDVASASALEEMEREFEDRVGDAVHLRANYAAAQRVLQRLQLDAAHDGRWVEAKNREIAQAREFAQQKARQLASARRAMLVCGIVLALQAGCALVMHLLAPTQVSAAWLALAGASLLIYAWLRRAGLRELFSRKTAVAPRPDSKEAIP
jgi:hypothetical protein